MHLPLQIQILLSLQFLQIFFSYKQFAIMAQDGGGLSGGWIEQDVNSEAVKALASRSVSKISDESDDPYQLIPLDVISAQSQVVAGAQYKLKIRVGRSNCAKSEVAACGGMANCAEGDQNARKLYLVTIWSKPWENFEQIKYEIVEE